MASDPHPDIARLYAAGRSRVAEIVSWLTDPAVVVVATVVLIALRSSASVGRGLGWAALALTFCVLVPYAALLLLLRAGRVSDRQIVRREQRLVPGLVALASVVAGLGLLVAMHAPRDLLALMVAQVTALVVLIVVSLRVKASLHTSAVAGAVTIAVLVLGWWALALAPLVPLVGWARVRGGRHTAGQVVAGAVIGVVVSALVFGGLRVDPRSALRRVDVALPGPVTAMAALGDCVLLGTYAAASRRRAGLLLERC